MRCSCASPARLQRTSSPHSDPVTEALREWGEIIEPIEFANLLGHLDIIMRPLGVNRIRRARVDVSPRTESGVTARLVRMGFQTPRSCTAFARRRQASRFQRRFFSRKLHIRCRLGMRICACVAGFLTDRVGVPPGYERSNPPADICGTPNPAEPICPVWELGEALLLIAN